MKKSFVVLALAAMPLSGFAAQESYTIDPLHTFPNFTIDHLGFSTMHGRFGKTTGKLTVDREKGTGSVDVTIEPDKTGVVEGNLTMAGVTKPVRLDVKHMNCAINPMDPKKEKFVCGIDATTKIKRSDFGVKFALPAVGDEMNIALEVEAIRD